MRLNLAQLAGLFVLLAASCEERSGDPPSAKGVPPPEGSGKRIREITDPSLPDHRPDLIDVAVSGAVVVAVDTHDETGNGKSDGMIYVQDLGSSAPYSGIALFAPAFIPGNLRVSPGDVLDLRGDYSESASIGKAIFAPGAVLPQMALPTARFRYEWRPPEPLEVDLQDLADFEKGRRWLGMLVKVKNVTVHGDATPDTNGRVAVDLLPPPPGAHGCDTAFPKQPVLVNELFDLAPLGIKRGTRLTSIVGLVTFFCHLRLAPRSASDVER